MKSTLICLEMLPWTKHGNLDYLDNLSYNHDSYLDIWNK
jgi:hypothetical protein